MGWHWRHGLTDKCPVAVAAKEKGCYHHIELDLELEQARARARRPGKKVRLGQAVELFLG